MPGFAGFDTSVYPGDQVMSWLKANTNLNFAGFYLGPAPSHPHSDWMDRYSFLQAAGWGFLPVYLGQEVCGPGSHNACAASGVTDGQDAIALMTQAGFPPGSFVYLDCENGAPFPQPQLDYITSWAATVTAGGFGVGIYLSHCEAAVVHNLVPHARIWCFKVQANPNIAHPVPCPYPDSNPSGCGYVGAYAWQLADTCTMIVPPAPNGRLCADVDSALIPDPSAP